MSFWEGVRRLRWGAVLVLVASVAEASANELTLAQVLDSTLAHSPKLAAVEAKVEQADGAQLQARGAYDLRFEAEGTLAPVGTYERAGGSFGLSQQTTAWGLELFAKYQNGADFPVYEGDLVTSQAGKVTLGALLPLLRGRAFDADRLELVRTRLGQAVAEQTRREQRAQLLAKAAASWWTWVVAGWKLEIHRQLLAQAEQRRDFLERQAASGAVPRVEVVDNERLLSARRAAVAVVALKFRQASLALGMFRRDSDGRPRPASAEELPKLSDWPVSVAADAHELLREVPRAPAIVVYDLAERILEEQLKVSKNERLPALDFELRGALSAGETRPYGTYESLSEASVGGRLKFGWDVQQRAARGKVAVVAARRREIQNERRLLEEQLMLDVQGQVLALTAQRDAVVWNRAATRQAEEVSSAERLAFESGQSSMLAVNLREQAVLTAHLAELDALLDVQLAWVELQRVLGRDSPDAYTSPAHVAEPG